MLTKHNRHSLGLQLPSPRRYPLSYSLAVIITLLSLLPIGNVEMAKNVPLADKWTHMVMYFSITFVIGYEYARQHKCVSTLIPSFNYVLRALFVPIMMGGLLELAQAYCTTYRSGDWLDFAANSIGCAIGTFLSLCYARIRE